GIMRGIEPEHCQVDNPDAVEVDEEVEPRPRLLICLEEALLPVDVLQLQIALAGRHVHELALILHDDALDTFRDLEELVAVIVADNVLVVALTTHVDPVENLVALVSAVLVQRSDDVVQVRKLIHGLNKSLASWRVEIIVGTLENEAKAFRHKSN